jgi:hypothetical protein
MDAIEMAVRKMFAAYTEVKADNMNIAAYLEELVDIPEQELLAVIRQAKRESVHLPRIATLLELHRKMYSDVDPNNAAEGWRSVMRAMHIPDTYRPDESTPKLRWKDPIVAKVVEAMGWHRLRMSTNQIADQSQFFKMYESFAKKEAGEQRLTTDYKQLRDDIQLPKSLTMDEDTEDDE